MVSLLALVAVSGAMWCAWDAWGRRCDVAEGVGAMPDDVAIRRVLASRAERVRENVWRGDHGLRG